MSDFDYTTYPDETLRNVLTNRSWDLNRYYSATITRSTRERA